jgi:hypothetical protein
VIFNKRIQRQSLHFDRAITRSSEVR